MKKKTIITAGVIAAFGLAILTSSAVYAQGNNQGMTTIVQRIAKKFNLNESDVQAVFDAERDERMAEMNKKFEDRLSSLVSSGKLTEDQKQKVLAKKKELEASRKSDFENFKNMTDEERKAEIDKRRTELESWAKENGIDLKNTLFFMGMKGHGSGMGKTFHMR